MNNNKLECRPVLLPANKFPGAVYKSSLSYTLTINSIHDKSIPQHLYLVSDKEIKEGDWAIGLDNTIIEANQSNLISIQEHWKKIEASTDSSLGLPGIPESFIEWYTENQGKDEKVEVFFDKKGEPILTWGGKSIGFEVTISNTDWVGYCKEQNNVNYRCENQCFACKKADDLEEVIILPTEDDKNWREDYENLKAKVRKNWEDEKTYTREEVIAAYEAGVIDGCDPDCRYTDGKEWFDLNYPI